MNLPHLRARLTDSGYIAESDKCQLNDVKEMLCNRFDSIDYGQAKLDALPFVRDAANLDVWNADFFKQITTGLMEK